MALFKDLTKKLQDNGCQTQAVDALVHDLKVAEAEVINNEGMESQLHYICLRMGELEILEAVGIKP